MKRRAQQSPSPQPSPEGRGRSGGRSLPLRVRGRRGAFTLIELIIVLTLLTIAISLTAPSLANFFRGRTLDSEARRLLALSRQGQSRAVSEGIPMELWIDSAQSTVGLEAEPSYETTDTRAVNFTLESGIQIQASTLPQGTLTAVQSSTANPAMTRHPNLPAMRFLPDGTIAESSPTSIQLIGRDGTPIVLALSRNRLNYEIQKRTQ